MIRYYPVGLNLRGKDVLIVGAGRVAERKIRSLLSFGAVVKVVAPGISPRALGLFRNGKISLVRRRYKVSDLKGARLVIAATSDKSVNRQVSVDAGRRGIWVNVVDDTAVCGFISTAIIRKHGIVISISTDGKRPALSRDFKNFLKGKLDEFNFNRD